MSFARGRRCALAAVALAAAACGGADDGAVDPAIARGASEARAAEPPSVLPCPRQIAPDTACGPEGSRCTDLRTCSTPTYACTGGTWKVASWSSCAADASASACPDEEPSEDTWCGRPALCSYGERSYACRGSRWAATSGALDAGSD